MKAKKVIRDHDRELQLCKMAQDGNLSARNALIELYVYCSECVAFKLSQRLSSEITFEELKSHALSGIFSAIETFNTESNTKFSTYAPFRIRGFVLDKIREFDQVPRLTREREKVRDRARHEILQAKGRVATSADLEDWLKENGFNCNWFNADRLKVFASLDFWIDPEKQSFDRDYRSDPSYHAFMHNKKAPLPWEAPDKSHFWELVSSLCNLRERMILYLYYVDEETMANIGAILGVSESRVCQVHRRTIEKLKDSDQLAQVFELV